MPSTGVEVLQWAIDTRKLWPDATKTAQLEDVASHVLALLTSEERQGVLKYYFIRDAKMQLASHLLKHYVLAKTLSIPWSSTKLSRDEHKKPIYVSPSGEQPVSFNVSHQAGIVALAAVLTEGTDTEEVGPVEVGVDVVCMSERRERDHKMIAEQGWSSFVDMHSDVFGRSESGYLKTGLAIPSSDLDAKLRAFYTLWCLREAYVKMTGEALLAPWLKDLEFRGFRAPKAGTEFRQGGGDAEETITVHEVLFEGRRVDDANICLRSLGPDYMTCTAIRTPKSKDKGLGWEIGPFEFVDVNEIVDYVAEENGDL